MKGGGKRTINLTKNPLRATNNLKNNVANSSIFFDQLERVNEEKTRKGRINKSLLQKGNKSANKLKNRAFFINRGKYIAAGELTDDINSRKEAINNIKSNSNKYIGPNTNQYYNDPFSAKLQETSVKRGRERIRELNDYRADKVIGSGNKVSIEERYKRINPEIKRKFKERKSQINKSNQGSIMSKKDRIKNLSWYNKANFFDRNSIRAHGMDRRSLQFERFKKRNISYLNSAIGNSNINPVEVNALFNKNEQIEVRKNRLSDKYKNELERRASERNAANKYSGAKGKQEMVIPEKIINKNINNNVRIEPNKNIVLSTPSTVSNPKINPNPTSNPKINPNPTSNPKINPNPTSNPKINPNPTSNPKIKSNLRLGKIGKGALIGGGILAAGYGLGKIISRDKKNKKEDFNK